MPEKKPKLTPLEVRKKILLLESELNRGQLIEAINTWRDEFHESKAQLTRAGSVVSMIVKVFKTFSSVVRIFSGRDSSGGKKSWLSYIFDSVSTGTSLWNLFKSQRSQPHDSKK